MLKKLAMTMASTALMFSMGAGVAFADGVTSSPYTNAADVNGNAASAAQTTTGTSGAAAGTSAGATGKSPKTGMEDTYAIAAATAAAAVAAAGAGVALRKETARK